jgi:hypothetical protein
MERIRRIRLTVILYAYYCITNTVGGKIQED